MTTTPTLELVDPTTLLTDRNIRTDLNVDKALIGSVKEHGVIVPITAVRDADGGLRVRAGHRRTAAAIAAGRNQVPVVIVAAEDDTDTGQAARIVGQIVENHHRQAMSTGDTVTAVAQLAAFGVSVAAITRRTKLPKATVTAAAAVAESDPARAAMGEHHDWTLTDLATIAEFDDDPDLQAQVIEALTESWNPTHRIERLRQERDDRTAQRTLHHRHPGLPWINEPNWDDNAVPLRRLTDQPIDQWPDRALPDPITPDQHSHCPGAVVWAKRTWTHASDEAPDADWMVNDQAYEPVHGCTQPDRHYDRQAKPTDTGGQGSAGQDEQAAKDAAKLARRQLIALNKAADAAAVVRREWLTTFSHRKTSPKTGPNFLLASLAGRSWAWSDLLSDGRLALIDATGDLPEQVTPGRAAHLFLCAALWAHDNAIKRDTWRDPSANHATYLRALAEWGYPLSEVEQIITGDLDQQGAYDTITT